MSIKSGNNCIYAIGVPSDTATTDGLSINVPYTGSGYVVEKIYVSKSRILATNVTANGATATLGIFGAAAGGSPTIFANAALTGLTGNTIVLSLTPAATALTPIVTATTLYFRTGTASGVTGSGYDVTLVYTPIPVIPRP